MKLYEVNQAIAEIFETMIDSETGEFVGDDELMEKLSALQMERGRILEYLAKQVLNYRSSIESLKEEERRLKDRRTAIEHKTDKLMSILDRECAGVKTDCGVATFSYRASSKVEITDNTSATGWLIENGHDDCYKTAEPEINKTNVKKLLKDGIAIPGVILVEGQTYNLK